jgi:hypothetical protein
MMLCKALGGSVTTEKCSRTTENYPRLNRKLIKDFVSYLVKMKRQNKFKKKSIHQSKHKKWQG